MSALITPEEMLDKAWEIWGGDALRVWYEDTLAKRKAQHETRRIGDGTKTVTVGKVYDLTIEQEVRHPGTYIRVKRQTTLRGWTFNGPTGWSVSYLLFQKHPAGKDWGGATRELRPDRILDAVEVTA